MWLYCNYGYILVPENRKFRSNVWYELPIIFASSLTNKGWFSILWCWLNPLVHWIGDMGATHVTFVTSSWVCPCWGCCRITPFGEGILGKETYGPIRSSKLNLQVVHTTLPIILFQRRQFLWTLVGGGLWLIDDLEFLDLPGFRSSK